MNRQEYAEKLKNPKWQRKRLEVLNREGFKCQSCDNEERNLQVHHLVYSRGEPWDAPAETLECLCEECHGIREDFNKLIGKRTMISTREVVAFLRRAKYLKVFPMFDGRADKEFYLQ